MLLLHAGSYHYPPVFDDGALLNAVELQRMADACVALRSRCITFTTFGLTYLAAGFDLAWFRLGNVLLHALTVLACFLFFDRLFEAVRAVRSRPRLRMPARPRAGVRRAALTIAAQWASG